MSSFAEVLAASSSHKYQKVKQEPRSNHSSPVKDSNHSNSDHSPSNDNHNNTVKSEWESHNNINGNNNIKVEEEDSADEDNIPLSSRKSIGKEVKREVKKETNKRKKYDDDDEDDDAPLSIRSKKSHKSSSSPKKRKHETKVKTEESPSKKKKVKEEDPKWKWWEEQGKDDGVKWRTLEHRGPVFAPDYERLPPSVHFYYDGKAVDLSADAQEVAGFYARMIDHEYTTRELFNKNFYKDWKKVMSSEEKHLITDMRKCNFKEIADHYKVLSEERKSLTKEQKLENKLKNEKMVEEYGYCLIDSHKQKIGNFRIEPPGLFRGRGDHPKQGMLKTRVSPRDVIINCSKGSNVPKPPSGHKWREVRHDNTVSWLASWSENIQGSIKYVMLSAASKMKGEKDWMKYETARRLHKQIDQIRNNYMNDWKSKEMRIRQRGVALYFIDILALRAGNEKDEDTADTVGCCSLRVEHLKLHDSLDGKENVVEFDFLGKDSIRYQNAVSVEKKVFKNLQLFLENKQPADDVFDRLNTTILNKHLQSLMDGLSAKVFRTYNASRTLQQQLDTLTQENDQLPAMILSYNRANRLVAILCNHQRAAPKNFDKQMENLQVKVDTKKALVKAAKKELKESKSEYKNKRSETAKNIVEKKKKTYDRLSEQLSKLQMQQTDKDENKEIALGTSKLNYLDPRISVAWCKKWDVPVEKIYNKTQREKFAWAIDMAEADYSF